EASVDGDACPGLGRIEFAIPGTGVHTITPLVPLPPITTSVLIDGFSQPGYSGAPLIEISGRAHGSSDGLTITGAGTTVRGLLIDGFAGSAIVISGPAATGNAILADVLGRDSSGSEASLNASGIQIRDGASDNVVGGPSPGNGN